MFKRRVVMLTCTWIIALAALLALTSLIQAQDNAENPDPFAPIFGQITASGQYDFIAQIEQTLIPRPIPANIGATEQRIDSQLSGEVVLPDYARVNLQFEADTSVPPFVIEQVGSDTFLIKDEERTQIENPLGVAPSTDFIGYMQAAENIQVIERPEQPHLTVYSFDIDGKKFADYFLQITRSQLPVEDQNATLVPPPSLLQMSGSGELWVDAEGYPQRQILDIHMPDMNERYDAQSHIVVDFNFTAPLAGVPLLTTDNVLPEDSPATAVASNPPANIAPTTTTNITLPQILLAIFSIVFVVVMTVLIARSHRLLRVSLPITLAVIIVAAPILQPFAHARTQEQTQEAALPSLGEAFGVVDIEETNEVSLETAVMQPNTPL
ncbi:MAG: hypothetical protein KDE48_00130, partial [Anaerolineales bacterium]|nr:hypothetical protein [Anaerolineales bacterium]